MGGVCVCDHIPSNHVSRCPSCATSLTISRMLTSMRHMPAWRLASFSRHEASHQRAWHISQRSAGSLRPQSKQVSRSNLPKIRENVAVSGSQPEGGLPVCKLSAAPCIPCDSRSWTSSSRRRAMFDMNEDFFHHGCVCVMYPPPPRSTASAARAVRPFSRTSWCAVPHPSPCTPRCTSAQDISRMRESCSPSRIGYRHHVP